MMFLRWMPSSALLPLAPIRHVYVKIHPAIETKDVPLSVVRSMCQEVIYVMLCYVMLCYVMLCYVMLSYVMLCYVMLCYVMLCYDMICYDML